MMHSPATVIKAGLIVGTLDISAAFINTWITAGRGPDAVLNFVASGVFGPDAFTGSLVMTLMGLLFHYVIAMAWTWLFFRAYPKISTWVPNWIVLGVLYGIFVWIVMNRLVVPLSNTPKFPFNLKSAIINAAILVVCIGLPLSWLAKRLQGRGAFS